MIPILRAIGYENYSPDPSPKRIVTREWTRQPMPGQLRKGMLWNGGNFFSNGKLVGSARYVKGRLGRSAYTSSVGIMPAATGLTLSSNGLSLLIFTTRSTSYCTFSIRNTSTLTGFAIALRNISASVCSIQCWTSKTGAFSDVLTEAGVTGEAIALYVSIRLSSSTTFAVEIYTKQGKYAIELDATSDGDFCCDTLVVPSGAALFMVDDLHREPSHIRKLLGNPWQIFEPQRSIELAPSVAVEPTDPPQLIAPISDIVAGAWTPSSGSDLFSMLNEGTPEDTSYIVASTETYCEMRLGSATDPAVSTGHLLRYRLSLVGASLRVSLKQGTTTIAYWDHTVISTTSFEQTLTAEQADSITDYSDLRISFEVIP